MKGGEVKTIQQVGENYWILAGKQKLISNNQLMTNKFSKFIIFVSIYNLVIGCVNSQEKKPAVNVFDFNRENQILLTNEADFKEHTSLYGASSFLIDFNSTFYAVTAKHLIGKDGGVEPEILPMDLPKKIESWKMYPRVQNKISNDTVLISDSNYKFIQTNADILLLKIKNDVQNLAKLKPNFDLPKENDSLFIIGCPYSEKDCRQNIYPCTYVFFDTKSKMLFFELKKNIELPGFSGAPIIDKNGLVVAVLTSGWEDNGSYFVGGTFIKEIEMFGY